MQITRAELRNVFTGGTFSFSSKSPLTFDGCIPPRPIQSNVLTLGSVSLITDQGITLGN